MKEDYSVQKQIDEHAVARYFNGAEGSSAAAMSMMAHEHNLPSNAAKYRLRKELSIISGWLGAVGEAGRVLDVGCGAGAWVEIFANCYKSVIGIENSPLMVEAARKRVAHLSNAQILQGDGRHDLPTGQFDLIFLGGLCMYLDSGDVVELLQSLKSRLSEGGLLILRESTVRKGVLLVGGEYQAIYRSVDMYSQLFEEVGISCLEVRQNSGYANMVIAEEFIDFRRKWLPFLPKDSTFLGYLTWWILRGITPISFWALPQVVSKLNIPWPRLQNHFFKLQLINSESLPQDTIFGRVS
ncbi:MAG: class I SAM-dependent methyltransferase [Candidatus Thiodiazotropha sp. (ex Lucinoma kastoroae)]|nr:class I SAM-dependent methyltransferase [Candidatus Thiodiazotropha sp. (ex Lucinoma kastoroae)]